MGILRKNQKQSKERKPLLTKMKNACVRLTSTLEMTEEGISELQEISIECSKNKKQREQRKDSI